MPVELPSGSHVDTPAWQSFEMRMRARAAERRKARRQRRLRRLTYALAAILALASGVASAVAWQQVRTRVVASAERAMAPQPIVVEWPPLPAPPAGMKAAAIDPLPVPSDWAGASEATAETQTAQAEITSDESSRPAGSTTATKTTEPPAAAERPTAAGGRRPQPAELLDASSSASMAAAPGSTAAAPAWARERRPASATPPATGTLTRNQPIEPTADTSIRREAAAADIPRESEPAPASAPAVGTLGRTQPSEPPVALERERAPLANSLPAPPPAAVASVAVSHVDPREGVRNVLERYRSAYQRLDASAARAVWPGVDAGALSRAFSGLSTQELWFEGCTINVSGSTADATCKGQSRIVPKIGGGSETTRRTWQFKLRQSGSSWLIDKATVK